LGDPQQYPVRPDPIHFELLALDEPWSVKDIDPLFVRPATLKLCESHRAKRHRESEKNAADQCENPLVNEHRLNDCETQDHSEHHEENNKE
jgi:hypothetical protein